MGKATAIHGWLVGDNVYLSLRKREDKAATNIYDSPSQALGEASKRGLPIIWENVADADAHPSNK